MHLRRLQRRWVAALLILVVAVAAGIVYWVNKPSSHSDAIGAKGGSAWSSALNVGVEVAKGGASGPTTFKFAKPTGELSESPMSELYAYVSAPVDITPSKPVTDAKVVFRVGSATVPAPTQDANTPDVNNAGIEVFNEDLGTWIPLITEVRASGKAYELVAQAPHFSIFRYVMNKIGEVVVNAGRSVKVVLTKALKPIDLLWNVGFGLVKTFYQSITGQFDGSKYNCSPKNDGYKVSVTDDTGQGKLDACVVKQDGGASRLLIKNGLAVPMKFTANGATGVTPNFSGGGDLIELVRNISSVLLGEVSVSGLDVASMQMAKNAPSEFTVNGSISWVAVAVDIVVGLVTVLAPESKAVTIATRSVVTKVSARLAMTVGKDAVKISYQSIMTILETVVREEKIVPTVAGQVGMLLSSVDCAVGAASELAGIKGWSDVTAAVVGTVKSCLSSAIAAFKGRIGELGELVGILDNILSQAKLLPEVIQLVKSAHDFGSVKVAFTVRKVSPRIEPLVGAWKRDCLLDTGKLVINPDYTATYTYDPGSDQRRQYTAKMHLVDEGGETVVAIVDSTNLNELNSGARLNTGAKLNVVRQGSKLYLGLGGGAPYQELYKGATPSGVCAVTIG